MSKDTESFLSNECMKAITSLSIKYPNDMDFGKAVRSFIHDTKEPINTEPIKFNFGDTDQPDMGDVQEY